MEDNRKIISYISIAKPEIEEKMANQKIIYVYYKGYEESNSKTKKIYTHISYYKIFYYIYIYIYCKT